QRSPGIEVLNRTIYFALWTTRTFSARSRRLGANHRNSSVAANPPRSWARTNPPTSVGRMPANVSLTHLASVTAGFANDVDAVNQYAAVMYAPTARGVDSERRRELPQMTQSNPNVATNSLKN